MRLTEASTRRFFRNSRTWKSVYTAAGKFLVDAYHLDVQSRVMPRRIPIGLTFWPMCLLALAVADHHHDVAVALDDAVVAPLGARHEAILGGRFVVCN